MAVEAAAGPSCNSNDMVTRYCIALLKEKLSKGVGLIGQGQTLAIFKGLTDRTCMIYMYIYTYIYVYRVSK